MASETGIGGGWGILLVESEIPAIQDIHKELQDYVAAYRQEHNCEDSDNPQDFPRIGEFRDRIVAALAEYGITAPRGATLLWTHDEDSRPAECDAPADEWILGFGLFMAPWTWPPVDPSFANVAALHSWVWMN